MNRRAPVAAAILAAVSSGFQPGGKMPPDTAGRMPATTLRFMGSLHVLAHTHRDHEPRRTSNIEHRTPSIEASQFEVGSSMLDVESSSWFMGSARAGHAY